MDLPPEIIREIALCNPRAYGVMLVLDKRIRKIISGIDPWAQFTFTDHRHSCPSNDSRRWLRDCHIKRKYDQHVSFHGIQVEVYHPSISRPSITSTTYTKRMYGRKIESTKWSHWKGPEHVYKSMYTVWDNEGNKKVTHYNKDGRRITTKHYDQNGREYYPVDYLEIVFCFAVIAVVAIGLSRK